MRIFTSLIENLSATKDSNLKESSICHFFQTEKNVQDEDCALDLLVGNYPKRVVTTSKLTEWTTELTGYPQWLIERSEKEVGNPLRTFNLLLRSDNSTQENKNLSDWLSEIRELHNQGEEEIKEFVRNMLPKAGERQRMLLLKLLTGTFKSPVSKIELVKSLAQVLQLQPQIIRLRLYECEKNRQISMAVLLQEIEDESKKIPYNFPEIKSIDSADELDLNHEKWRIFGKKDGLEVQAVKHENSVHLWSREGDLITDQFPEIVESISMDTPNFKCYGQILPKNEGIPLDQLLARLNKKSISKKAISNCEAVFELWEVLVGDAIETHNQLSDYPLIQTPKSINISSNDDLIRQHNNCRNLGFTGFILKPKDQAIFYSWKAASFSVKAILLYVEFGGMDNAGIRSITFGVYSQKDLFPIAKILDFEDIFDADTVVRYVKENTIERFGPVRTVKPQLVYEIEFDGISKSSRRKSGLVLTNPKISQKVGNDPAKANDLQYLKDLL